MKLITLIEHESARLEQSGVSFGHGTTNAFDEAVWLALWRLGLPLDDLDGVAERHLSPEEIQAVTTLTDERIARRTPAAYLTGEAWLQGVPFHVDPRTIVPRSLIAECLAEGLIDALLGREPETVLDLCTGNGSLAILSAMAWPDSTVTGTDLSADALAVAELNRQRHQLAHRLSLQHGDGLAPLAGCRYDLILCNPPYVNAQSMQALPDEFRAEPEIALHGGSDGMDFIRPLIAQARGHLSPDGWLVLEIGHERPYFEAAFPMLEPLWIETSAGEDLVLALPAQALPEPSEMAQPPMKSANPHPPIGS